MKNVFFYCLLLFSVISIGQNSTKRQQHFNLDKSLAIQGYDPIAYFKNKPLKGKKEFSASYEGATYYFDSKENRDAFLQSPAKYEPQYGVWCAYAMGSSADKVEINPETFKIIEGKLYLFYNAFFNNTLKSWNKEEKVLKAKADANWKKITH